MPWPLPIYSPFSPVCPSTVCFSIGCVASLVLYWRVFQSSGTSRDSRNHELLHELHEQYGNFVRTGGCKRMTIVGHILTAAISGPSELTVFLPEALIATDGPKSTCTRSAWYDFIHPMLAVGTVRSRNQHEARRRMWDLAFSSKGIRFLLNCCS